MKRGIVVALAAVAALFVVSRATNFCSYARTLWSQAKTEAKRSVPTKFELERIRAEIKNLDADLDNMIRPVAEYKAVIERLRRDIARGETNLDGQKKALLAVTEDLKANPKMVVFDGRRYSPETMKVRLGHEFDTYKRVEANLTTQRKLLEAKEASLRASQEQLLKVVNKKREFEVRLAQLEAEEETLQIARIGSDIRIDNSRATQIEDALRGVEDRQEAERQEISLRTGGILSDGTPVQDRNGGPVDVDAIRTYLEGGANTTASNK
jgi:peptidoglycan hydrolase CwlO-like protein